jgi:hypothetical protein
MKPENYEKLFPSCQIKHPEPHGWIQWKGTDVCLDINCKCGTITHIDAEFCYHVRCGMCGQIYECDGHIQLHPLDFEPEGVITTEL